MSDEPPIRLHTYLGIRRDAHERIWDAVIDESTLPVLTKASFMYAVNKMLRRPHLRLVQKQLEPPE